jgi:hypothetical protein
VLAPQGYHTIPLLLPGDSDSDVGAQAVYNHPLTRQWFSNGVTNPFYTSYRC